MQPWLVSLQVGHNSLMLTFSSAISTGCPRFRGWFCVYPTGGRKTDPDLPHELRQFVLQGLFQGVFLGLFDVPATFLLL